MGLDGISVNQLRVTPENNSAEMNNQVRFNLNGETRIVDGLSQGQKVDPDKEREKQNQEQGKKSSSEENDVDEEDQVVEAVDVIKYDLSKSDKYSLKVDDLTNSILIIDKSSKDVVQKISADELSVFVNYLTNSQGSIVSKRY